MVVELEVEASAGNPFECVRAVLPPVPARPEIESARYWAEALRLASTPERKSECHEKMMLSLFALGGEGKPNNGHLMEGIAR